ncbi:hypothetical protein SAMN05192564_102135 [Paraburkholderia sartisoli]|uniref:Uncharacterized protein n=1 Tax=Paraburkholderia sartisoli TaxID=83784 RepID=A0A1H4C6Y0_9BURK|nr:hypothetical protein SAMN05192564_102135 [Paraburkholderia sartisoli]
MRSSGFFPSAQHPVKWKKVGFGCVMCDAASRPMPRQRCGDAPSARCRRRGALAWFAGNDEGRDGLCRSRPSLSP